MVLFCVKITMFTGLAPDEAVRQNSSLFRSFCLETSAPKKAGKVSVFLTARFFLRYFTCFIASTISLPLAGKSAKQSFSFDHNFISFHPFIQLPPVGQKSWNIHQLSKPGQMELG